MVWNLFGENSIVLLDDLVIIWINLVLYSSFIDEETEAREKWLTQDHTNDIRSGLCLTYRFVPLQQRESKLKWLENLMKILDSLFRKSPISIFTHFRKKTKTKTKKSWVYRPTTPLSSKLIYGLWRDLKFSD